MGKNTYFTGRHYYYNRAPFCTGSNENFRTIAGTNRFVR
jgi:hypothetical protein